MDGRARPRDPDFRVSPVDRHGRTINPLVRDAAEQVGRRAIDHAEKLLIDPALAANLLEEAAATVTRAMESERFCPQNPVRDLPSYLFSAFLRRVNRIKSRQLIQEDCVSALSLGSTDSADLQQQFELKILVDEFLIKCDPVIREMFYRRLQGFSWKEIASYYGISSHAAESRFSKGLKRTRKKLGLKGDI